MNEITTTGAAYCPHGVILGGLVRCLNCRPYTPEELQQFQHAQVNIMCNCHECTQARYRGSFQWQIDQAAKSASPSEPRTEIGKPCPTCGKEVMPEFGPGEYSCAACGFGMQEPCEHWKKIPAQPKPEDDDKTLQEVEDLLPPHSTRISEPRRDEREALHQQAEPKSASPSASVGRVRGGGYWCACCGDITKPCEHWQGVAEFLESASPSEPRGVPNCDACHTAMGMWKPRPSVNIWVCCNPLCDMCHETFQQPDIDNSEHWKGIDTCDQAAEPGRDEREKNADK
jgi:hypothetical protein